MPHALLLAGPAGLGKRAFAERLARALLCDCNVEGDACGTCRTCKLLEAGTHPDAVHVTFGLTKTGKSRKEITVDQIRDLAAALGMSSQFGGWKVVVIDPADAMNASAANALLKTLEEPAGSALVILVADAPWRLPATIRSRCQRVDFHLPARSEAMTWLREAGVDNPDVALDAAAGNPGLARAWSTQGLLEERETVRSELVALAGHAQPLATVMQRWSGDESLAQRLWFAAQMAAMDMRARAVHAPELLGSHMDDEALADWFGRVNGAREALRGPLRPDLVVVDVLSRWR